MNGEPSVVDAVPDSPLPYVLRNDLGLNGSKFGCGLGQCGACAAIVAGKLTRTCLIALQAVGNDKVTTLEGLGTVQKLMSGITSRGWSGYPILAFPEVPSVEIILMNSECAIIPTDA